MINIAKIRIFLAPIVTLICLFLDITLALIKEPNAQGNTPILCRLSTGVLESMQSVAVLRGVQRDHGPRLRTFGNPEGAPQLRKNWKEIKGKYLNTPLRHNNFNEKELEE